MKRSMFLGVNLTLNALIKAALFCMVIFRDIAKIYLLP